MSSLHAHAVRRRHVLLGLTALPLAMAGVAACGESPSSGGSGGGGNSVEEVKISTPHGEASVPRNPQRVVVLDATVLENMAAIGVDMKKVVGVPKGYLRDDLAPDDVTDVAAGTTGEVDYEAIDALTPDLIIAGWRFSPSATEALKTGLDDLGVPYVDLSPSAAHTAQTLNDCVSKLGVIFDRADAATEVNKKFDGLITEVKDASADAGTGLVIMVSGGKVSLTGDGPESRSGIYYDSFGVKPPIELNDHIASHGDEISFEGLAATKADWLFVIDRDTSLGDKGSGPASQVLKNDLVEKMPAGAKDQIVYFDPELAYLGEGILTFIADGEAMRKAYDAAAK